ncbi:MerR family transcriptional regulator [Thiohalomonas denitrificans]|uniref:Helix-turn-helix domain-containing protein n=1 Tax=Thiohalomonas denitrificans TaxID=415747 RepID=A0A1G5PUA5_9GAMM|nr:DNA-binding protein [Thiohalomonas denitrificans]SCZ52997.1 hypothetical protein SAMN03097708_00847 [Thiohalomonas denitrificans]
MAITELAQIESSLGVVHPEQFAKLCGGNVTTDKVEHWIRRGYLPSVKIGRARLVNLVALNRELSVKPFHMEREF